MLSWSLEMRDLYRLEDVRACYRALPVPVDRQDRTEAWLQEVASLRKARDRQPVFCNVEDLVLPPCGLKAEPRS